MLSSQECFFFDGVDVAIVVLIASHQKHNLEITFLDVVQYAQAKGDPHQSWRHSKPKPWKLLFLKTLNILVPNERGALAILVRLISINLTVTRT